MSLIISKEVLATSTEQNKRHGHNTWITKILDLEREELTIFSSTPMLSLSSTSFSQGFNSSVL